MNRQRLLRPTGAVALVAYCLAPFAWMVISSLRRPADQFSNSPIPSPASLENYRAAFDPSNGFAKALLNSVVVAGITTIAVLVMAVLTSYAIARLEFRFKGLILATIIGTAMFPGITILVPMLEAFISVGWINTYQAMILPTISFTLPLAIWTLTAFFRQMPMELEKAAQVDGCGPFQAFYRIILPLAAPGVFTTAILTFIAAWNEFMIAASVVNRKDNMTANVILSLFTGQYGFDQPFGTQMAAGTVLTLPLVVLVLICQRRIVDGLTAGGVK
ncbi:carbohydrate ABC transporter permease [Sphaerisporangium sp. NPDC051017]|uniref:carbohydrate ABC transporter permease n=1 Tax=unclassified Sphaerisporangium TaxID=2630420 RepID=UPI0033C0449E